MYDQLRNEYESVKRSAIQPAGNFFSRNEPDLFSNPANIASNREAPRRGNSFPFNVTEDLMPMSREAFCNRLKVA